MRNIWHTIKNYYVTIGKNYHVDPIIFLGIHVVATPLFILCVAWLIKNYRQKRSIILPAALSVVIFNASNFYLILFGKNIPWWLYTIVGITTITSAYFSYKKNKK